MNRKFLNPFDTPEVPEKMEDLLEDAHKSTCFAFNRQGNLIAAGTTSGHLTVWDFETHSLAAPPALPAGGAAEITAVAFLHPRTGPLVMTVHGDGVVRVWDSGDVEGIRVVAAVRFPNGRLVQVAGHPRCAGVVACVVQGRPPVLVKLEKGDDVVEVSEEALEGGGGGSPSPVLAVVRSAYAKGEDAFLEGLAAGEGAFKKGGRDGYVVAFAPDGRHLLRTGPGGRIEVFRVELDMPQPKGKAPDAAARRAAVLRGELRPPRGAKVTPICALETEVRGVIKSLFFSRSGRLFCVGSTDRYLRTYSSGFLSTPSLDPAAFVESVPLSAITDKVNRLHWRCACFSWDGEYILAGMAGASTKLLVYRTADGGLEKTLEGPKEGAMAVAWHPRINSTVISLGERYGGIYVWVREATANWSAFAAHFEEIDENVEYSEREDDFDQIAPQDEKMLEEAQDELENRTIVDIMTFDRTIEDYSSDSDVADGNVPVFSVPVRTVPHPEANPVHRKRQRAEAANARAKDPVLT